MFQAICAHKAGSIEFSTFNHKFIKKNEIHMHYYIIMYIMYILSYLLNNVTMYLYIDDSNSVSAI